MSRVSRTFVLVLTALMTLLSTSAMVSAQNQDQGQGRFQGRGGPGGSQFREVPGGDWLPLLRSEKVQKEIDLLADQKKDLDRIADEARDGAERGRGGQDFNFREASQEEREKFFREAAERREAATKETVKKIEEILLPPQVARLKEISLQARG